LHTKLFIEFDYFTPHAQHSGTCDWFTVISSQTASTQLTNYNEAIM